VPRRPQLVFGSSPLDSLWRSMALLMPLGDDATLQEQVDNMPVVFIQHANNVGDCAITYLMCDPTLLVGMPPSEVRDRPDDDVRQTQEAVSSVF
jgi:hypothetical protein